MYKLPERRGGGWGGEVIWAMPERKHLFLKEVFPYADIIDHEAFHLTESNTETLIRVDLDLRKSIRTYIFPFILLMIEYLYFGRLVSVEGFHRRGLG